VIRYIYDQTYDIQGGIGYASAMSFIYFALMAVLLTGVFLFLRQWARRESR
jgi:ABC-type sugar transport system permease subunit